MFMLTDEQREKGESARTENARDQNTGDVGEDEGSTTWGDWLRSMAGNKMKRLHTKDGEFNLDLSFVTKRIIAMGLPSSGIEGVYRHSVKDISAWLNQQYNSKYKIFNLSERTYSTERFEGQVVNMGWPDHHGPNMSHLFCVVREIASWLQEDKENIVAVHCMAGKGRTGTAVSCLLVYLGNFDSADDAMRFFGHKRSAIELGVQQPSQIRAVRCFSEAVLGGFYPAPIPRYATKIQLDPVPSVSSRGGIRPRIQIFNITSGYDNKVLLLDSAWNYSASSISRKYTDKDPYIVLEDMALLLQGDIYVKLYHYSERITHKREECVLRCTFNTNYYRDHTFIQFKKEDLDLADKDSRFPKNFSLWIFFGDTMDRAEAEEHQYINWTKEDFDAFVEKRGNSAAKDELNVD